MLFRSVFIIAYLFTVIDNFFSSIVLNFFVPEQKEDDLEGLYTDSKYLRDPDTGEMYTWPELIKVLNNDDACEANFWENLKENVFKIWDENFKDACQLMRYIKQKVEKYETTYMGREEGKGPNKLDRGLILATIFYGYDSQATYDSYDTPPAKEDEKGDTYTSASDHYETLKNVIKDGKLVKLDVDRIIQSTIFEDIYPYFTWVIRKEKRNIDGVDKIVKVGYCDTATVENYEYSRDKWEMFIRWNDEWDRTNGDDEQERKRDYPFSVPGYLKINSKKQLDNKQKIDNTSILTLVGTGYTYDTSMNNAWNTTSTECNGTIPPESLKSLVDILDDSVNIAQDYFTKREFTQVVDTTVYFQKIEDVYTQKKDSFRSGNIKYTTPGPNVATTFVEFEYKHGFGYVNFPSFKQADEDSNLPTFEYDDIVSPKKIEEIILEVKDRKGEINNTLLLKDLDSSQYGDNGYWDEDGNYIPGIDPDLDNDNVVKNAYCKKFVPYDYEDITVELTDCDGNQQESVNFKDYIIGTVKGEIDNYSNKNYALTQMIANINFALQRRGNQNKLKSGSKIKMRNGDCDQVFSSKKGSYKHTANLVCKEETGQKCVNYYQGSAPLNEEGYTNYKGPMSDAEYKEYEKLYEIAKNYLVIKDGRIFETGYVANVSIKWEAEANAGKNFLQILKETYDGIDIIECSGADGGYEGGYDPSLARKGCVGIVEAAAREVGAPNGLKYIHWFNDTFNMNYKDNVAWCAIFASWVGYKTGYDGTQVTMTAGADAMLQGFRNRGKGHKKGYVPKAGDYVFFDYERKNDAGEVVQPQDGVADHVAIVRSYDPNTHQVCTIGGNEKDSVKNDNCFGYADGSVLGYGEVDCKVNNKKGDNRKDEIK